MEAENTEGGEEASKGKTSTFSVSTILEKCNKTVVEEESNVDTESRTEDMTLEQNVKDFPMSEGVNNIPTLQDLVNYDKSLIESGRKISVQQGPFNASSYQLPINLMVLKRRLEIEAEQEIDKKEGY